MTYLELVQTLAREGGTTGGASSISTVAAASGRAAKLVAWVADAWRDIQNESEAWLWMRHEFEGPTLVNLDSYAGSALGATRLRRWLVSQNHEADSGVTIYAAGDVANEGGLLWLSWDVFRRSKLLGTQTPGAPRYVSIDPQRNLRLAPKPDGVYTIRGEYIRAPQTLVADNDAPEMPEEHHHAIVSRALDYLATDEESAWQKPAWSMRARRHLDDLRRDQLPRLAFPGPLA